MARFWVGVASREHVLASVRGAFCQLNHGKEAPVRRLQMGDRIVFYSPRERMEGGESLQAFTAAERIVDEVPCQVEQSKDFRPFVAGQSTSKAKTPLSTLSWKSCPLRKGVVTGVSRSAWAFSR